LKPDQDLSVLIEPSHPQISITRQCALVGLPRSSFYYQPVPLTDATLQLMRKIDEIYTQYPYYGSPRITAQLKREGVVVNHKAVERLMKAMGLQALYPRPNTSQSHSEHQKYPYLLKNLMIDHANQVWGVDITYIRLKQGFCYLAAILDWFSRYVVSFRTSLTLESNFCLKTLSTALATAQPEIHNSDQGVQFTAHEYINTLKQYGNIQISMDGRGRCFDNIFTERLWRTVKYEEVYLHDYQSFEEAQERLSQYFHVYNHERLHQSLNYQTPAEVYFKDRYVVE